MWSDEAYPQRRSLRLRDYDYAKAGAYFVTVCVANRACFLGEIIDGAMRLSSLGRIVAETWLALPARFPVVDLDAFVVMPNHFHGIIMLNDIPALPASQGSVGAEQAPPLETSSQDTKTTGDASIAPTGPVVVSPTLGRVIQVFKSVSAIACNRLSDCTGSPFWQRGYYDRVIRDHHELNQIRAYIANNPTRWTEDSEYPIGDW